MQNWFSPGNRFANRIFGSVHNLGEGMGAVSDHAYLRCSTQLTESASMERVERVRTTEPDLIDLARQARGDLYIRSEGIDSDDLELRQLDARYRQFGLFRSRRIYVVRDQAGIAGAAFAYRSSLGINLSLLENRCELLIRPTLENRQRSNVVSALVQRAKEDYRDFSPGFMPITLDLELEGLLVDQGAQLMRRYRQGTWAKDVYAANIDRMDKFFNRITRRLSAS